MSLLEVRSAGIAAPELLDGGLRSKDWKTISHQNGAQNTYSSHMPDHVVVPVPKVSESF